MNPRLTEDFLACLARLPDAVDIKARKNYGLSKNDPPYPGPHLKIISTSSPRLKGVGQARPVAWAWQRWEPGHYNLYAQGTGLDEASAAV